MPKPFILNLYSIVEITLQGLPSNSQPHFLTAHVPTATALHCKQQVGPFAPPPAYANGHRRAPARDPERAAATHDDNDEFQPFSFAGRLVTTKS
jgi:hypothetical protein